MNYDFPSTHGVTSFTNTVGKVEKQTDVVFLITKQKRTISTPR